MVKIRYAELPTGLHVATEADDRCTIVYLKPGLTREQRKEALMVARRSARFGHGPSLPTLDMAFALAADRTRTTASIMASAMRKHPSLLLPVLALVVGIITAGFLASAAMVTTVPPGVSSAQSGDLVHFSVGQLVIGSPSTSPSSSPGPKSAAPSSGTVPVSGGASHGSAPHGGVVRGAVHDRIHLAASWHRHGPGRAGWVMKAHGRAVGRAQERSRPGTVLD